LAKIRDELTSHIHLNGLKVYLNEYIPFSSNQILSFNDELDVDHNVKEGLLTSMIDDEPEHATFELKEELTKVSVTRADPHDFVVFDASIVFKEVVHQKEEISCYVDAFGRVIYGAKIEKIDGQSRDFSIDKLTRVIADLVMDSSVMIYNLLSTYQRRLLDLVFSDVAENRNKFIILLAEEISPYLPSKKYQDGEDLENELNQIIQPTTLFTDITTMNEDKLFFGPEGMILVSKNAKKYEQMLCTMSFYFGLNIFQKNYFQKMFMLWDELKEVRILMGRGEVNPNAVNKGKAILKRVSASVVLMKELLAFMRHSVINMNKEVETMDRSDPDLVEVIKKVDFDTLVKKALVRINDAELVVSGLIEEVAGINGLINSLAEKQMSRMNETLNDSIESMDEMTRASDRTGVALNILEVLLAGAIAFDVMMFLSGEYAIEAIVNWVQGNIYIWIFIGLASFFGVGFVLWKAVKYLESKSEPNMRVRISIGREYNNKRMEEWLSKKNLIFAESLVMDDNIVQEYS